MTVLGKRQNIASKRTSRLPSLKALQAFESASRLQSFRSAAIELGVTESAVSRQISILEQDLGQLLFVRSHRAVTLTKVGELLAFGMHESFDRMRETLLEVGRDVTRLRVKSLPTIGLRWLLPRVQAFRQKMPKSVIEVVIDSEPADFRAEDFDAAIVYGHAVPKECEVVHLFTEDVQPFASPDLLSKWQTPVFEEMPILYNTEDGREWRHWLGATGLALASHNRAAVFDTDELAIQAAIAGHGVGLFDPRFLGPEIEEGRLVPLPGRFPASIGNYYFVYPRSRSENRIFRSLKSDLFAANA